MTPTEKLLYTAKTHTTGGREHGVSRSSDGHLDIRLSTPGVAGIGTNPEQLFAAGWSACFEGAMGIAARKRKIRLPEDLGIDAEVDLNLDEGAFFSARASMSACRVSIVKSHRPCSTKPTRLVRIRRQFVATSTSLSISSDESFVDAPCRMSGGCL
jgi:lipoyl-dependent peroxiredoxin